MYRKLVRHKGFKKDFSKVRFSDDAYSKYIIYIGRLLSRESLPLEAKDHQLKGEWKDFREFHLSGDLLVIYRIEEDILELARIGTHSQLFE